VNNRGSVDTGLIRHYAHDFKSRSRVVMNISNEIWQFVQPY